jgi:hypothetical protein
MLIFLKHLYKKYPPLSEAELKEYVSLVLTMFDEDFLLTMTEAAFKRIVSKFLGNNKNPDYVTVVANMLQKCKFLGCLTLSLPNLFLNFSTLCM